MEDHRYSRQSYSIGKDVMNKINDSSILIIGYNTLSLEIIKNSILIGINTIEIFNNSKLENNNKTGIYYKNDKLPLDKLRELNPIININEVNILNSENDIDIKKIKKYKLVILTNSKIEDAININHITHKLSIPFIMSGCYGLYGYVFNDFGDNFTINDEDGEEYENLIIEEIDKKRIKFKDIHNLSDNDILLLNVDDIIKEIVIKNTVTPKIIELTEEIELKKINQNYYYKSLIKKKISKTISFNSLKMNVKEPDIITTDFSIPVDRNNELHELHLAYNKYKNSYGEDPRSWSLTDYELFKKNLKKDTILSKKFCYTLKGDLLPIASILGGIVVQELLKAIGHKYIPIKQWYYIDYLDLISDDEIENDNEIESCLISKDYISNNKYEGIINIFGKEVLNKIQETVPFVVGSGAIGCELIKNLGMLGVKNIILTDMDYIEKSNLSRQFLFNDNDIRKSKAQVASLKIKEMNSDINITVYENRVCKETEDIFNKEFHSKIDIYLNALDNIEARNYMDQQSIKYMKPLIDSGTLGSKGNVQVIIPNLTESYGSSKDPEENADIPICTIKSFPYKSEHTIQWARELFESEFTSLPLLINKYNNEIDDINEGDLKLFLKQIEKYNNFSINKECYIKLLVRIYYENYDKSIDELIEKYRDNNDIDKSKLPIKLEITNKLLENYMIFGFSILNQLFSTNIEINDITIDYQRETEDYQREIDKMDKEMCKIKIKEILKTIPQIKKIDFEKDNDELHHIYWINECSNLRNRQYSIELTDIYRTRRIAGKIIPAMITTTSLISGFQILEFIKLVKYYKKDINNQNDINIYKNRFVNLNINYCDGITPEKCKKYENFSLWSKIKVSNTNTVDIITEIELITNKKVEYITSDNKTVYDGEEIKIDNINFEEVILVLLEDIPLGIPIYFFL